MNEALAKALARLLRLPGWLRWLPPPLVMATLWWSSSSQPTGVMSGWPRELFYNGMHVVAYFVLALAYWIALGGPRRGWWCIGLAAGYGLVDEWHQAAVPGRVASWGDVLSDLLGAWLAVAWAALVLRTAPRAAARCVWVGLAALSSVLLATWVF